MAMNNENLSPQALRTKQHFKKAFTELIIEKVYSHVTVTDIVQRAAKLSNDIFITIERIEEKQWSIYLQA